jgi:hypothetical protein
MALDQEIIIQSNNRLIKGFTMNKFETQNFLQLNASLIVYKFSGYFNWFSALNNFRQYHNDCDNQ